MLRFIVVTISERKQPSFGQTYRKKVVTNTALRHYVM